MSNSTETYKKTTDAVKAAGEKVEEIGTPLWEETKAGVTAASDYTADKAKEGYTYAQEKSQPTVDAAKHNVQEGLRTISKNIDAAADSLEKKEPTAWEQTKTVVSDAVDTVTQSVQEGWKSLTSDDETANVEEKKDTIL